MEQLEYRSKARIIAILDLIIAILTLWHPVIMKIGAIYNIVERSISGPDPHLFINSTGIKAEDMEILIHNATVAHGDSHGFTDSYGFGLHELKILMLVIVGAIFVIFQFVANIKLLKATKIGQDPLLATQQSRFWRNLTIVFTVLFLLFWILIFTQDRFLPENIILLAFILTTILSIILIRLIGIYFVHKYILELDLVISRRNNDAPNENYVAFKNEPQGS